jgi:DNA-directed RNA polymerase subunit RPC12/RpoP
MITVVIPRDSSAISCVNCGHMLYNLAKLGIHHQVDCQCGAKVVVDRRVASNANHYPAALDRRRPQQLQQSA